MFFLFLIFFSAFTAKYYVTPKPKTGTCMDPTSPCSLKMAMEKTVEYSEPSEIHFLEGVYMYSNESYFSNNPNLTFVGEKNKVQFSSVDCSISISLLVLESDHLQIVNINFFQFRRAFLSTHGNLEIKLISTHFKNCQPLFQSNDVIISKLSLRDVSVEFCSPKPLFEIVHQEIPFDLIIRNCSFQSSHGILDISTKREVMIDIGEKTNIFNLSSPFKVSSESPSSILTINIDDSQISNLTGTFFTATSFEGEIKVSVENSAFESNQHGAFQFYVRSHAEITIKKSIFQHNVLQSSIFEIKSESSHGIIFDSSSSTYGNNRCPVLVDDDDAGDGISPHPCVSGGILLLYGVVKTNEKVQVKFEGDEIYGNMINENNEGTILHSDLTVETPKEQTFDLMISITNCTMTSNQALGTSVGGILSIEQHSNLHLNISSCTVEDSISYSGGVVYVHGVSTSRATIIDISSTTFHNNRVRFDARGLMANQGGVLFFDNDLSPPPGTSSSSTSSEGYLLAATSDSTTSQIYDSIIRRAVSPTKRTREDEYYYHHQEAETETRPVRLVVQVVDCEFRGSLSVIGGALSIQGYEKDTYDSLVVIDQSQFYDNGACYYGGAIFALKVKIVVKGSSMFLGNSAVIDNGCSHFTGGVITYGGSIVTISCDVTHEDTQLDFGSVQHNGGAISSVDDTSLVLKNTRLWNNKAGLAGGSLFYTGMGNLHFDENTESRDGQSEVFGGGLLLDVTSLEPVMESQVTFGIAGKCGGGIYYSSLSPHKPPVNLTIDNQANNGENYLTRPYSFKVLEGPNPCKRIPKSGNKGRFECELRMLDFYDAYGQRIYYDTFYPFQLTIQFDNLPSHAINDNKVRVITLYVFANLLGTKTAKVGLIRANGDTLKGEVDFLFEDEKKTDVSSVFASYWWILVIVLMVFVCFICFVLGMVCCQHRLKILLLRRKDSEYIYLE